MEASGGDDANDEDALGVVSRYALFQTLYYYFASWLHFLNIIFPFFPSLFHLLGTTFFKIRKWETRFLSLFSPSGGGRDIVVESSFPDHRHRSFYRSPFSDITQSPSGRPTDQRKDDDDQREHQIRLEDDVVSFSSRDKTHKTTLWTDRFATPKKFKEQQQQQQQQRNKNIWRRRRTRGRK